jgi:hypothetical protein
MERGLEERVDAAMVAGGEVAVGIRGLAHNPAAW